MPRIKRTPAEAVAFCRMLKRRNASQIPPDYIGVQGHCVGLVARAYTDGPAGYVDAHAMLAAVTRAGKLRTGKAPVGAVLFWRGGKHGHVGLKARAGFWGVDLPRSNRVGRVSRGEPRRRWGYRYMGWCLASDVPGWAPLRAK